MKKRAQFAEAYLWRVQMPGETKGGWVEVEGARQAKVSTRSLGTDGESTLIAGMALNRFEADWLKAAKDHAQKVGVDLLLVGALSREGKGLALDSFLYDAQKHSLSRLPKTRFDTELLSLDEVANRAEEAWRRGGTEVCIQGGLHPDIPGDHYLSLLRAVKARVPLSVARRSLRSASPAKPVR